MQTLQHLAADVVGRAFDHHPDYHQQNLHRRHNPGGYFEDPEIYYGGAATKRFQDLLGRSDAACAVKMDLRHLADHDQTETWRNAAERISAILISIRDPSEQAHSEEFSSRASPRPFEEKFMFLTQFLADYSRCYGVIADGLSTRLPELQDKMHVIDYAASSAPEAYVASLAAASGLRPGPDLVRRAVQNITPALYRARRSDLPQAERDLADRLGAAAVYARLKHSDDV